MTAVDEGVAAPESFFVPDLIRLEVGRGDRVVVVSDLHLPPAATDVSARAADELAELLDGFREPGMLVLAGDAFELLAAAPDVAAIMDAHPQFTAAVKRFAADITISRLQWAGSQCSRDSSRRNTMPSLRVVYSAAA